MSPHTFPNTISSKRVEIFSKIRQRACWHRAAMLGPTRNDRNLLKVKMYCSSQLQNTCFNFIFFDILKWPRFGFQNSTNFIRAPLRIFHPTKVNFCPIFVLPIFSWFPRWWLGRQAITVFSFQIPKKPTPGFSFFQSHQ